ncbi:MAG: metallophosphoesterase [bacterium]
MLRRLGPVTTAALLAGSVLAGSLGAAPALQAAAPALPGAAHSGSALSPRPLVAFSLVVPRSRAPSGLIARAILPKGVACPPLVARTSSGKEVARASRPRVIPESTSPAFTALRSCEARMPRNATWADFGGLPIPASMPARIDRLAMVGDTGCRIWESWIQDCTSAQDWPYARIAQRIAEDDPDLIVHMGDYFYREETCPEAQADLCANSPGPIPGLPFTDTDYSWLADAIVPMAPLFPVAPILALRGNHEECFRGGNGWFLFFDPSWQSADECAPQGGVAPTVISDSYAVDLPIREDRSLRLVVVDSSNGSDTSITPSLQPAQRAAYEAGAALAADAEEPWLLTHRPLTGLVTTLDSPPPPTEWTPWTWLPTTMP